MPSVVFVCALVLLGAVCQATYVIKGEAIRDFNYKYCDISLGLYCRDPDTGKLYAVNSTWPSQTFCGNYTCKLRKRNTTETQYLPLQKINISEYLIPKEESDGDMAISPSQNTISVTKQTNKEKHPIFHTDFLKSKDTLFDANASKDSDRYLTESEIKVITDMLHTVKKSDLEAIVDIYNLAQDIYKEIDTVSTKNLVKEKIEAEKLEKLEARDSNNKQSYWYEPLHYHSKHNDMSQEGTNVISTKKSTSDPNPTFFKGSLTDKDFGKLPYYYPISNFQRLSSYMHPKPNSINLEGVPKETKPCTKLAKYYDYVALPLYGSPAKKSETQSRVQTSTLLPYPFSYVYHYNVSGYPSNPYYPSSSYYSSYYNPWTYADYSRLRSYPQSYYGQYASPYPSYAYIKTGTTEKKESVESNSERKNLVDNLVQTPTGKNSLPDWQTEPLSEKVLDEVRAYVTDKPKPLLPVALKKNIKLEKVGKVIKLDEIIREKRDILNDMIELNDDEVNDDEFETYVEKTTCEDTIEVGYFSYGNMTQPFPGCCPKKIDSLHITKKELINYNK